MINNRKKILLIAQHFYPEMVSTGLHMTELTTKWKELYPENEISVFCANSSKNEFNKSISSFEKYKNVGIHRVNNLGRQHGNILNRIIFSISFIIKCLWFLLKNGRKYDIILITTNPPFLGILILLFHSITKKPYVVISYDIYPQILDGLGILRKSNMLYRIWFKLNTRVYLKASKIISIGEDMSQVLLSQIGESNISKIEIIHNWADKNTVFPVHNESNIFIKSNGLEGKKILLYSGTMGTTHDIESILEASIQFRDREDILFLFIGGGAKFKVVKEFVKIQKPKNVLLLPFQPIEIISETLSAGLISFVCLDEKFTGLSVPSKSYGIMAAKGVLLGIMDKKSEIAKTIIDNNLGNVWSKNDKTSLASIINSMLADEIKLNEMSENSYRTFINNFEIEISVKKYNDAIVKILNKNSKKVTL